MIPSITSINTFLIIARTKIAYMYLRLNESLLVRIILAENYILSNAFCYNRLNQSKITIELEKRMILAKFFKSKLYPGHEDEEFSDPQAKEATIRPDIASLIMDAEFECQGQHISKDLIVSLINLYTDAIEYYEEVCNYKARMYKKRLQVFLSKSSVSSVLQGKDSHLIVKKQVVETSKLQAKVNSKEMANRLIEKCEKRADSNKKVIQKDLKNQRQNLEARIERRKSMSNRSVNSENDDFDYDFTHKPQPKAQNKHKRLSSDVILIDIKNRNMKRVFI